MRTAIYARVSTDDKGQDTENQLLQLREFCKAKGHLIIEEYIEEVSGTGKVKRPKLDKLMADARLRKFDILLVWSYDRFSRAGLKDITLILRLIDYGVQFVSLQEPFLDTTNPMAELLIPFYAWIAKQEAKKISERTKAGLEKAKLKGHFAGRPQVKFNLELARTMRASGASYRTIAKELECSHVLVKQRLENVSDVSKARNPDVRETDQ